MSLLNCALCNVPITNENDSKEHLIPNSIGGRKKIKGFICTGCNNRRGEDWDADLARQLNPLSVFFGISRERGEVPSHTIETANGEQLQLNVDGSMGLAKPKYEETPKESGIEINIHARSMKEAKQMLAGLKQKFPQIDIDKIMSTAQSQSYYPDGMLNLKLPTFGGHKAGRSIVKTCLALAVESGVNPQLCGVARDYLIKSDGKACFGYYYERDLIGNRPEDVVFHCVAIGGNPDTKQLLGYVEYYSALRMVVCLTNEYDGIKFTRTYALNPISGKEIEMEVDIASLSPEDIAASYRYERMSYGQVGKAFERVLPIGIKRSQELAMEQAVLEAVNHAFKNCGAQEGEMLTEEHIHKLSPLLMEKLTPYILHQSSTQKGQPQ